MSESETQLTLQDELKTVGSKNGTGDLTYGQQQAVLALFQQALTSLKREMGKKAKSYKVKGGTLQQITLTERAVPLSECQRLIDGIMK